MLIFQSLHGRVRDPSLRHNANLTTLLMNPPDIHVPLSNHFKRNQSHFKNYLIAKIIISRAYVLQKSLVMKCKKVTTVILTWTERHLHRKFVMDTLVVLSLKSMALYIAVLTTLILRRVCWVLVPSVMMSITENLKKWVHGGEAII